MKDLFYSPLDKKLFWIAGYTDNSYNVKEIISVLQNNLNFFLKQVKFPQNTQVNTEYITKSRRYKSMRYFWINDVEIEKVPKEAFILTAENDWSMYKWIEN